MENTRQNEGGKGTEKKERATYYNTCYIKTPKNGLDLTKKGQLETAFLWREIKSSKDEGAKSLIL